MSKYGYFVMKGMGDEEWIPIRLTWAKNIIFRALVWSGDENDAESHEEMFERIRNGETMVVEHKEVKFVEGDPPLMEE